MGLAPIVAVAASQSDKLFHSSLLFLSFMMRDYILLAVYLTALL